MDETVIVWTDYMKYRVRLRGFDLAAVEPIVRQSAERYLDTVTGRRGAPRSVEKVTADDRLWEVSVMTGKQFYDWQTAGGTDDVMRLVDCLERADVAWCAIGGGALASGLLALRPANSVATRRQSL